MWFAGAVCPTACTRKIPVQFCSSQRRPQRGSRGRRVGVDGIAPIGPTLPSHRSIPPCSSPQTNGLRPQRQSAAPDPGSAGPAAPPPLKPACFTPCSTRKKPPRRRRPAASGETFSSPQFLAIFTANRSVWLRGRKTLAGAAAGRVVPQQDRRADRRRRAAPTRRLLRTPPPAPAGRRQHPAATAGTPAPRRRPGEHLHGAQGLGNATKGNWGGPRATHCMR